MSNFNYLTLIDINSYDLLSLYFCIIFIIKQLL